MDWFVRRFVKASLVWLCVGVVIGAAMAVHPAWTVYRAAHLHATLLGFVTMMIYGVAYHVLPRFAGSPLRSPAVAGWHWWIANVGLVAMVAGFILRVSSRVPTAISAPTLAVGGVLSATGAVAFAWNIWQTIGNGPALTAVRRVPRT